MMLGTESEWNGLEIDSFPVVGGAQHRLFLVGWDVPTPCNEFAVLPGVHP